MIKFNPDDNMNFNEALNSLLEIAAHQSGMVCAMEFSGACISVEVPKNHVALQVSNGQKLSDFSSHQLTDEIFNRVRSVIPKEAEREIRSSLIALEILMELTETK